MMMIFQFARRYEHRQLLGTYRVLRTYGSSACFGLDRLDGGRFTKKKWMGGFSDFLRWVSHGDSMDMNGQHNKWSYPLVMTNIAMV
jgi:hypothetical protein